jgi:bifunctional oligoribonuclease and PAP phosphatase NrnA
VRQILERQEWQINDILARLRGAERILIAAHEHPDGDAVGSCLALWHALAMQGKQAQVYVPDAPPDYLSFLPGLSHITTTKPAVADFDVVVVLDCTQLYRAHLQDELVNHPNVIVIDHHVGNDEGGDVNLVVPAAAATAHILVELFKIGNVPITRDMATCLLTGIFTDTGSFMHNSTTPEILELASELMNRGARLSHIAHETYQKKELPALRIWGEAFSRVMVNPATGAAVSIITYDDLANYGATRDDLDGVVNMLNTLPQTKFALLLTEYEPGKIKGSLRSEPQKGIDVSQVAQRLGGGGHKLAAGFEISGHLTKIEGKWRIVPLESGK